MTANVIAPIVHRNGTGKETLLEQRLDLHRALRDAGRKLCQMGPNGRDFYVEPGLMEKAYAQHDRRLRALRELIEEIEAEIQAVESQ